MANGIPLPSDSLTKFRPEKLKKYQILNPVKNKQRAQMALSLVWLYFGNLVRKADGSGILEEFRKNSKSIWFLP